MHFKTIHCKLSQLLIDIKVLEFLKKKKKVIFATKR